MRLSAKPVRAVLAKATIGRVESARDTALSRAEKARKTGDMVFRAGVFAKVAEDASRELEDRFLAWLPALDCGSHKRPTAKLSTLLGR